MTIDPRNDADTVPLYVKPLELCSDTPQRDPDLSADIQGYGMMNIISPNQLLTLENTDNLVNKWQCACIPFTDASVSDVYVDWGDHSPQSVVTTGTGSTMHANITLDGGRHHVCHVYAQSGVYRVRIWPRNHKVLCLDHVGSALYRYTAIFPVSHVQTFGNIGITSLRGLLYNQTLNTSFAPRIDTSSIVNMAHMFHNARNFNQPIGNWNTANVKTMESMFSRASQFNQGLSHWDTSNVFDMSYMFAWATSFNGNITSWDTRSVEFTMYMFFFAGKFNQPIGHWNVANVASARCMFDGAINFAQDLTPWKSLQNSQQLRDDVLVIEWRHSRLSKY